MLTLRKCRGAVRCPFKLQWTLLTTTFSSAILICWTSWALLTNPAGCTTPVWLVARGKKKNISRERNTHSCCRPSRSWGKRARRAAASSAAGACGSRCRSARLSGCAAWRCWWSSRWRRSPGRPPGSRCWTVGTKRRREMSKRKNPT